MSNDNTVSLDTALGRLGILTNFSVAMYKNKLDKEGTKRAREVGKKFLSFMEDLREDNYEFAAGMDEFQHIGHASYLAIKHMDSEVPLLFIAVPQEFINVEDENEGEEDEGT